MVMTESSTPSGCDVRLVKLRANSSAPTARNNDNATCATTRILERLSRAPLCVPRPLAFSAVESERSVARHAGAKPNRKLVSSVIVAVNITTRASMPTENGSGPVSTPIVMRTSKSLRNGAIARPTAAASRPSRTLSISNCVMMRLRLAPIDNRTAISRWRLVARASSRFAVLAQAMSSSNPTIPSSA